MSIDERVYLAMIIDTKENQIRLKRSKIDLLYQIYKIQILSYLRER